MRILSTRSLAILLVGVGAACALAPLLASAQGGSQKFQEAFTQGSAKYASRDFAAAVAAFRNAVEADPKNPLGHYLLGEAQLAAGNVAEAEASYERALAVSSEKDPATRARILFVIADLKERQWKWDDAKAAWQAYLDWAHRFPNAGAFPASAQSRLQVIDAMLKQDKAHEIVRRRIAETKDGGAFTDLSKSAPEPAK